ncbi:hypothetical protein FQA39_LY08234 [Lamprigera yunnana]|nr:hypothetical protein FQA39_LY08234 [Lamprigera yunnana]
MATFRNNSIVTLETMPGSDAKELKLIFSYCKIKYLLTGLLENAINTRYLDLSHNEIEREQLSADVFKGPYNNTAYAPIALEELDLSYNRIHSLQKNLFIHTPNLKSLNLEGNSLRVIDHLSCLALAKATKMQFFNLARNKLTEVPGDAIKHFKNLTEINLSFNELDFVPESLGYVAQSLQIVNVSNNPIVEFEHNTFEGFEHVIKLYANNLNKLLSVRARIFTPLKRLQILELSHCELLREIDEEAFAHLQKLKEVYLNDNNLRTISPLLLPWNQIEIVDIRRNQFMCNCDLYNISQQLPNFLKSGVNSPYCVDPVNYCSVEIVMLTNETCSYNNKMGPRGQIQALGNFRVMKITLVTLIIVLVISSVLAVWLGYVKWRVYQRNLLYPFPSEIVYSPVTTGYKC